MVKAVQPWKKPCLLMASPSGDLRVLANMQRLPTIDISTVIKYDECFLTWEAHWHREDAKPESTEATKTGMIPENSTCSGLMPLEEVLLEPSPTLRRTAAMINKHKAPICCTDCFCLQDHTMYDLFRQSHNTSLAHENTKSCAHRTWSTQDPREKKI